MRLRACCFQGDALENLTIGVSVTVSNTGDVAGSTPVIVAYSKQTHGVVRNLRDLAAFTKIHLQPGQSEKVTLAVRLVVSVLISLASVARLSFLAYVFSEF